MITVQNNEAIKIIQDQARLNNAEGFPAQLRRDIQPVMDMSPDLHRVINVVETATSNSTIYTTPALGDFYLYSIDLSAEKTAADTGTAVQITVRINGVSKTIMGWACITATAGSVNKTLNLAVPLRVDRNAPINLGITGSFTALRACISGSYVPGFA